MCLVCQNLLVTEPRMLRRELVFPGVRIGPCVSLAASRCGTQRPRRPSHRRNMSGLVVMPLPSRGSRDLVHDMSTRMGRGALGTECVCVCVASCARARAGLRLGHAARAHCSTTSPFALTARSTPSEGSHTLTTRCPATRSASACSGRFAPGRLHASGVGGGTTSSAISGGGGAYTVGSCRCVLFPCSRSPFRSLHAFRSVRAFFSFLALRFSCLRSFMTMLAVDLREAGASESRRKRGEAILGK